MLSNKVKSQNTKLYRQRTAESVDTVRRAITDILTSSFGLYPLLLIPKSASKQRSIFEETDEAEIHKNCMERLKTYSQIL